MKIKVKDLAAKVDTLCHKRNGELFDFEEQEDGMYRVETEHYLHAELNPDDELEWSEFGTVEIQDATFRTCLLTYVKPDVAQSN